MQTDAHVCSNHIRPAIIIMSVCRKSVALFQPFSRTYASQASSVYTDPRRTPDAATKGTPHDLTPADRLTIDRALRVDQAGEIAANWIYRGQYFVLGKDKETGPLIHVSTVVRSSWYIQC